MTDREILLNVLNILCYRRSFHGLVSDGWVCYSFTCHDRHQYAGFFDGYPWNIAISNWWHKSEVASCDKLPGRSMCINHFIQSAQTQQIHDTSGSPGMCQVSGRPLLSPPDSEQCTHRCQSSDLMSRLTKLLMRSWEWVVASKIVGGFN